MGQVIRAKRFHPGTAAFTEGDPLGDGVVLRQGSIEDAEAAGRICYEAFGAIAAAHNFPPDFPSPAVAVELMRWMLGHPGFAGIVAEADGRVVGSNFVDLRSPIAGIGPITVDPAVQNRAIGRRLMEEAERQAARRGSAGVRLVQSGYHLRSLSLYAKLGFEVREPLACMHGAAPGRATPGYPVRPARAEDLAACNDLCARQHGHHRGGELADAVAAGTAAVVEREGRITGYTTGIGFFGHAVAETEADLEALIAAAAAIAGPGVLVPTRNAELFRWCLAQGLRVVQPMTLMTLGDYREPAGPYLPSVMY